MSRYRKVSTELHGDDKFARLSPVKPSGQSLWIHLLIGPCRTNLPGLIARGEAGLAEELGWPLAAFRRGWAEIAREGLAETDGRVTLLPNAIRHNLPESLNVIKAWRENFDLVPASPLKRKALALWRAAIEEGMGDGFRKAFRETFPEAYPEAYPEGIPDAPLEASAKASPIQEQEQEQETPPKPPTGGEALPGFEAFWATWPRHFRKAGKAECRDLWRKRGYETEIDALLADLTARLQHHEWTKEGRQFMPAPIRYLRPAPWREGALLGQAAPEPSEYVLVDGRRVPLAEAMAGRP